jgi:hypothetical protein
VQANPGVQASFVSCVAESCDREGFETLVVLGAWLVLAIPVALFMGRLLRVGTEKQPDGQTGSTFGRAA